MVRYARIAAKPINVKMKAKITAILLIMCANLSCAYGGTNDVIRKQPDYSDANVKHAVTNDLPDEITGVKLIASVKKNVFTNGEHVILTMTLKNDTTSLVCFNEAGNDTFSTQVFYSDLSKVPLTLAGRFGSSIRRGVRYLEQGKSLFCELPVSKIHEMTKKDKYKIFVLLEVYVEETKSFKMLTSNAIEIEVVDDDVVVFDDQPDNFTDVALIAAINQTVFTNNEPIMVNLTVKNESFISVLFFEMDTIFMFTVNLTDLNGKEVQRTTLGKEIANGFWSSHGIFNEKLSGKESKSYRLDITKIYDVDKSGKYLMSFEMELKFGSISNQKTLTSNTIEIDVVDADTKSEPDKSETMKEEESKNLDENELPERTLI